VPHFDRAYNLGGLLLECVCAKLQETDAGCPERRCLVPGAVPSHEDCCEGQLTVNIARHYPSFAFPTPALGAGVNTNCEAPYTVVTYVVQIIRCMPTGHRERPATCAQLDDTAFLTMVDMEAVRQGIDCCFADRDSVTAIVGEPFSWMFGDHDSYGPEGGCVGSTAIVLAGIPNCREC
jgi:hypothetical protein